MKYLQGYLNALWKFFVSVKLSIFLLFSLAATSIIGTVIPQNKPPAEYVKAFGEFFYRAFGIFDFFDMYRSWWFQVLIVLLLINIVVCSIDRLSRTWKIIFVKKPQFHISRFRSLADKKEFIRDESPRQLQSIYETIVAKRFEYSHTENTENGFCIFAEKWRWTRFGVYVVHLSIVLLLIGAFLGSNFGFEGFVNIPEGKGVTGVQISNSDQTYPLDFEIRCEDFNVTFYESGTPKEFRSSLTILENNKPVFQKDIIVNDPLRFRGINIFQSSYGLLPPEEVTLNFTIKESDMSYIKKLMIGQQTLIPEGFGTFVLKGYTKSAAFRGHALGEAFIGVIEPANGEPIEIILPLRFPSFDRMRKGEVLVSVEEYEEKYYTGLQVTKDPGVWVVYSGFILMIIGCFITFFMSHQRICVEAVKSGKKTKVMIAGTSNKNKLGMENVIARILKRLNQ
ncbi:MAG: cytochrome c biogenesis protein ResB [Desulfobacterales bacterium]